ncbi:MAG: transcriptional repressor NrdR [Candidatus Acidulodesulfobacterium ferriphilum]|jgi:transcriptional repressor NrdR|uniref:Transcriptional repressor NrdR n=1 Tax=Candidatus Acidulodesulfobacterium ferriphilum TaxID=2597223 RepID=A0A519BD81_9DELT|nr:transcriptional regulator NrdR [Deltaproteobacteria bacterium]MCL5892726.1 transcriptional regulator NrdR [Deltaproteobacteria bacterium]MDA8053265.1 transcriptional regulator NrdR [Deltaproteobacteria bacterium]RZD15217.1 MAG: transcriptional repressor NrdR [Candidatus Acidulodesulfobacterium ferriphilum]
MKCPFCFNDDDKVVDSRVSKDGRLTRRKRQCNVCGKRFSTLETIIVSSPLIIKKDGRRESFDRQKILSGLIKACEKRPVPYQSIEEIVQSVERWIDETNLKEIKSEDIGKFVLNKLKSLDAISYVRFASVYLSFKDINELYENVSELIKKQS